MSQLTENDIISRAEKAKSFFTQGYNCAQSVYMAYADLFGMDVTQAAVIAAPLGGGMGRLREVCGACSASFLIAGLAVPCDDPNDADAKKACYAMVQRLAERFREENGSIICRELLGLGEKRESPAPSPRTAEYYRKRPCAELVYHAALNVGKEIIAVR